MGYVKCRVGGISGGPKKHGVSRFSCAPAGAADRLDANARAA